MFSNKIGFPSNNQLFIILHIEGRKFAWSKVLIRPGLSHGYGMTGPDRPASPPIRECGNAVVERARCLCCENTPVREGLGTVPRVSTRGLHPIRDQVAYSPTRKLRG